MYKWKWFDKYGGWLAILIAMWLIILFCGCTTNKQYDLLHREALKNLVNKSITIEDYKGKKEYN